jgi:hypothetical protein
VPQLPEMQGDAADRLGSAAQAHTPSGGIQPLAGRQVGTQARAALNHFSRTATRCAGISVAEAWLLCYWISTKGSNRSVTGGVQPFTCHGLLANPW